MKTMLFSAMAAVLVLAGDPPAHAQTPLPPVAIDDCKLATNVYYIFGRADIPYVVTRGLSVTFHLREQKNAAEIHFRANYRGEDAVITDVGSFAPGVKVTHQYEQFVNFAYLGLHPNVCRPIFVRYTDGTTWSAPVTRRQATS
jgi:hypothetical protein